LPEDWGRGREGVKWIEGRMRHEGECEWVEKCQIVTHVQTPVSIG